MSKEENKKLPLPEVADRLGIGQLETHLFICAGPDCCEPGTGEASWKALKKKIKEMYPRLNEAKIYRTRVGCLRICRDGPIAVAYPQGKWFKGVTAELVGEVVEYLASGRTDPHPLEFRANPLPPRS